MGESILKILINAVEQGHKVKIDLKQKNLWIGKRQLVVQGRSEEDKPFINKNDLSIEEFNYDLGENPWKWIEYLYNTFKHSVPSEHNQEKKTYFKGLSAEELTDNELAFNISRDIGQAMLEGYILCAGLQGWLKWNDDNQWFWQGQDKNLVILKDWI
ncbi:hypothetical protein [Clostridium sp.]|uniref:hypothetical protein n=1 Tax=Clostridium sp. TaxID=1506 RepID=UPI00321748AD